MSELPLGRRAGALYNTLRNLLSQGLPPDGRLPSENELCATYDISRTAVRRALARLSAEGLIRIERGRGAFATPSTIASQPARRSNAVAVMYPFDSDSLVTVQAEVLDRGLVPMIFSQRQAQWDPLAEQRFLRALISEPPLALLAYCTPSDTSAEASIAELTNRGTRCLHLDLADYVLPSSPYLAPDFAQAGFEAAARAAEHGYRTVTPVQTGDAPYERRFVDGVREACASRGLALRPSLMMPFGLNDTAAVQAALGKTLDALPVGTVLACRSLDLAALIKPALGVRFPRDIGLIAIAHAGEPDAGIDRLEHDRLAIVRRALDLATASEWKAPHELVPHAYRRRGSLERKP